MEKKELRISEEYLTELISYCSRSCVGKVLKRYEIIANKDILKSTIKELIYESWRDFRDLLEAHNKGLNITQFNVKNSKEEKDSI